MFPRRLLCLAAVLWLAVPVYAQLPPAKSDAQLDAEATEADKLYNQGQSLASLPLYEELHTARPKNAGYTERLAMAYIAKGAATADAAESVAARNHARKLFAEAQAEGDQSDLLQVMMEKLGGPETATARTAAPPVDPNDPRAPGGPFEQAELLFGKGDLKGAVELYQKSWEQHPNFYPAPLYAGDSEYKLGHYDEAGVWFARAIAIDPDFETAHRYWGDCLMKAGKPVEAGRQFLDAFLGDPYQKAPRLALRGWAESRRMHFIPPAISLPAPPTKGKNGDINITIGSSDKDDALAPVWLMYSMNGALWQGDKFKQTFPNEKVYRHSLAEEMDGLHMLLTGVREQKIPESKLTPTIKALMALEKDGMLECWILLDNPDQGTAQDYLEFRSKHRDLLKAYVEKYDLHPA